MSTDSTATAHGHKRPLTRGEELANSLTHAAGTLLATAGLTVLVSFAALRGTTWHVVSCSVYGATLVLLFKASTLYHLAEHPPTKRVLRVLDHSSIFLLIAGTYTPFALVSLRGPWGWTLFGVVWGLAVLGILGESLSAHRFRLIAVPIYIAMGWLVVLALKPLLTAVPLGGVLWLFGGGLFYTVGVVFYAWRGKRYTHTVWHLFVLAGSVCHWFSVMFYVIPSRPDAG
jgi:hemolysin III